MESARAALAVIAVIFAGRSAAGAERDFTRRELESVYYYDLGPEEADVSGYPVDQQANYRVFKSACSRCHTLARPLNAPIVGRRSWEFYVFRMHVRGQRRFGTVFNKEDEKAILDFLAYDSEARKTAKKEEFASLTRRLESRFSETIAERLRRFQQKGKSIRH